MIMRTACAEYNGQHVESGSRWGFHLQAARVSLGAASGPPGECDHQHPLIFGPLSC